MLEERLLPTVAMSFDRILERCKNIEKRANAEPPRN